MAIQWYGNGGMADMIQVKQLHKTFTTEHGGVQAVQGVNFEIEQGEIFTLLGPSGCGKTTLLRLIAGLESVSSGRIVLGGDRLDDVPPQRRDVAMARKKKMKQLTDDEIPNVLALGRQIVESDLSPEQRERMERFRKAGNVTTADQAIAIENNKRKPDRIL